MRAILLIVIGIIVIFISALFCKSAYAQEESVIYRSVNADSKSKWDKTTCIFKKFTSVRSSPIFFIESGVLFLRVQSTHTKFGLYVVVNHEKWDTTKIREIKSQYPHIIQFLPDPNALNGGIKWIEEEEKEDGSN